MTLGTSIFLIAVGAIIRYAVTFHVSGVSRPTIGRPSLQSSPSARLMVVAGQRCGLAMA
jgi:hypothetical protein